MPEEHQPTWPVARSYVGEQAVAVSLPVGGIGTGTVGFGGRGQFRDWELEDRPAKGLLAPLTFLACRATCGDEAAVARVLEGPLFDNEVQGALGAPGPLSGLPRFAGCKYEATYPFARVVLTDPLLPVSAAVEVFNPLVPGDDADSGLPLMLLRVELFSRTDQPIEADVMFSVEDLVGHMARSKGQLSTPVISERQDGDVQGFLLGDRELSPAEAGFGTLAACVWGPDAWLGPAWALGKWDQGLYAMWQGFVTSGRPAPGLFGFGGVGPLDDASAASSVAATLGAHRQIAPGGRAEVLFALSWHFPNRRAWVPGRWPRGELAETVVGNNYCHGVEDAWGVLKLNAPRRKALEDRTAVFVSTLWATDVPDVVKEAALFNLSTLRSQTVFRTADGYPFGWEGCLDDAGSCLGSCTHVWNYEMATGFLFGALAQQMRELEYRYATGPEGAMSFRIMLPLERASQLPTTAADGQFGCVLKLYREWRLSGDDAWMLGLWPHCKRSMEFAWVDGGWDADRDGLLEGAQHNTTDIEYFGPNPVVQGWYLAALLAAAEMAEAADDPHFAATLRSIYTSGAAGTDKLFNGRFYRQEVVAPGDFSRIAPRLRYEGMGTDRADKPEFQIGDGCIIDQLVGDTYGRLVGLGPIFDEVHAKASLGAVHRYNYVEDFGRWTNYMRTYAVSGERGHIVCSYPDGLPEHPMPYWSEVWTGLEYVYASSLALHGEPALAEDVVLAARERFSGRRRNPFDEMECGHHYARAMASWGTFLAFTGFDYDARSAMMKFAPAVPGRQWFWSTGRAWGQVRLANAGAEPAQAYLTVEGGRVEVAGVSISGVLFRPEQGDGELLEGTTCTLLAQDDHSGAQTGQVRG